GGGSFASAPSYKLGYSELYTRYGIDSIYGISPQTGNFITDVFWPKVIAQAGWFGLLTYVAFLLALGAPLARRYRTTGDPIAGIALITLVVSVVISLASSPFNSEYFFVVSGLMLGSAHSALRISKK